MAGLLWHEGNHQEGMIIFAIMRSLFFLLFFPALYVSAQDKILLLNGKVKEVAHVEGLFKKDIVYTDNLSPKQKKITINKVFSVTSKGREKVFYKQDSAVEYYLTTDQMRWYIKGEQEAIAGYKGSYVPGGVSGLLGSAVLHFAPPLSLIPPAIGFVLSNRNPPVSSISASDPHWLENEAFVAGYQRRYRTRKIRNAALGSAGGLVIGFVVVLSLGLIK